VSKLSFNKSNFILILLAILSALFFGIVSLVLTQLFGHRYIYFLALPAAMLIGLLFIFNRYIFFLLVVLSRSSLDVAFNAIKFGSFGLGAVLNALVIMIALLILIEKPLKIDVNLKSITWAWVIFLGLSGVSLAYAPGFIASLKIFLIYVSYAAMFVLGLALVKSERDFGKWIKAVVLSSLIPVAYGILSLAIGGNGVRFSIQEGLRLQSTFPHPNTLAPYLVLVITICFYLFRTKSQLVSQVFLKTIPFYILLLLGLVLMTKTRSAWVACYLFFGLYALFYERKYLVVIILAPFFALLIPDVQERVFDLMRDNDFGANGYGRLNSYAWRKQIWTNAISWMTAPHYILGYGVSSFIHYSTEFGMANAFERQKFEINAHSVYVQMFFELGIFGVISFIYLIYAHIKTLMSVYSKNKLLIFTVIVLLVEFLFESYSDNMMDYLIFNWYLWFVVGLTLSYVSLLPAPKSTGKTKTS
jgi:O-antigen ligase